jgi:RNA-directed DNA polymerase
MDCEMDKSSEMQPAQVPPLGRTTSPEAKQAGEIRARWAWAESEIWTNRMLTALEKGVKGGAWFSLVDKVYATRTLRRAFKDVKKNAGAAGVDHQTIGMFERNLDANLDKLSRELREETYQPKAVRRAWIPKPGNQKEKRPLGIPTVRDRVVQTALRYALEPVFEREFAERSYGFRPGRGCKAALRHVIHLLEAGYTWVVDADLKSYFDTIPHRPLLEQVGKRVSDGRILKLIKSFLAQDIMEAMNQWTPEAGSPQGAVMSPLLSNIYLNPLDHHMAQGGCEMIRYADDFVILCRSQAEAEEALAKVRHWTSAAGLQLHPEKTCIVDATQRGGFDFLGYHFERGYHWPRKKSLQKFKDTIRAKTHRTNGLSMEAIIQRLNPTLAGWFGYFKHSHRTTFPRLDSWIRMRLRSILRKRRHRRGRSLNPRDHRRWPNHYFADMGLFSLVVAHASACQSSRR